MVSRKTIQAYANAIGREFRPRKIILFGSYASGRPSDDSDVDLMVIMPVRGRALRKSLEIRERIPHPGFPLDLLVRTPEEVRKRLARGDTFLREVTATGTVLYEAGDA